MGLLLLFILSKFMNPPALLLAPFKGLTDMVYRNAYARYFGGFDAMYAPFIYGTGHHRINPSKLTDVTPIKAMLSATVPQFLTSDPREAVAIAKALAQEGYTHINWNMGCPFSRIADKKRGCGILPYPDELDRLLQFVFQESPISISIKTRLGYYHPDESIRVMEVLNRYPLRLLIIHARIGIQIYAGEVNLDGFAQCLSLAKMPVVYNGDVFHKDRFDELSRRFPEVSAWMMGRGALINPFLAREIKGDLIPDSEKRELLRKFLDELETGNTLKKTDSVRHLGYLKAVWFYLAGLFMPQVSILQRIKKTQNLSDYKQAVDETLDMPFSNSGHIEKYFRYGVKHLGNEQAPIN